MLNSPLPITKHPLPSSLELTSTKQALYHPQWRAAMSVEIQEIHQNNTWNLVLRQLHQNIVGCK